MAITFKTTPDNRYFEDYISGEVHEFGAIPVDEEEVIEFGKRYVPLSYHVDKEAAKKSIYGGLIASGWHTAALMMRIYTENYLSKVANLGSPGGDELRWDKPVFPGDEIIGARDGLGSAPFRIPPRPRHRPHFYRSFKSEARSGDEHEDGKFREKSAAAGVN